MKRINYLCALLTINFFFWHGLLNAQEQIDLCPGTGEHCMRIEYGAITLKLVRGKTQPEIIIKSNR